MGFRHSYSFRIEGRNDEKETLVAITITHHHLHLPESTEHAFMTLQLISHSKDITHIHKDISAVVGILHKGFN